ncbi:efflux RND transporter periplasmic adaptor subunit [Acidobacteria bacterium AH-259-O06]|nr:efflux RND transporter periplasmic adaptor subunit [Acidobacteria bacterium AH-259-O06]
MKAHRVGKRSISTFIIANTTLESIRDVTIYSTLNAIVSHLYVEEGDRVNKGWLVARLDETEIRNEFDQAQIAVDQANVALGQAEVKAQLSAASYKRAQSLFEQKLTSQEEFDQAELINRTDELALENAKQQLEAAKVRLEAAGIQLGYTKIPSPIQGVITERLVDVGDRVNVNENMFTVQEFPPLWARIFVPEKALPQLKTGQETQIVFEAYPENEFNGRIKMISPTIDAASGTVKVTIEITRAGRLLRPGMFATVYIATQTHDAAIAIPKKAILRERDLNYVFLIQPDKTVIKQEVRVGFSEENWVEVLDGVQAGNSVVTIGYETLNDGYLVRVADWEYTTEPIPELEETPTPPSQRAERRLDETAAPQPPRAQGQPSETDGPQLQRGESQRSPGPPGRAAGGRGGRGEQMLARLLQNPEIRKQYEEKLAEDPDLANDPQKRRAFAREMMSKYGISRGNQ